MSFKSMEGEKVHVESLSVDDASMYSDAAAHQGALILEQERHLGVWESAKLHRRALLICSVSFTAGMLYGYDSIANGASIAMPSFFLYFGSIGPTGPYLPSLWTSLWSSLSLAAQAVGAIVIGFVTDRFGRKWPASASSALTIAGTAIQYTAHSRGVLLSGKVINGLGIGAAMAIATAYASEIAPLKLRGPVQQALVLFYVFMLGLGLAIVRIFVPNVKEQAFRDVFAIQWIVGGIATIAFAVAPESPNFLINKGRLDQAHKVMSLIYGSTNSIDARLAYLVKTIREEQADKELHVGTYPECFKGANLKRTLSVVFIYTAVQWGGAALLSQSIYFLIIAGLPAIHSFDVSIGGFALSMIIIVASWIFGDKLRRRNAFLAGCCINFFFMLVIGALYYAKGTGPLWGIAVLMNVLITFQTSLIQGMGFPIAAEISSLKLRAKTLSIGIMSQAFTGWLTQFVVPYMYNVDSGNLGARTGFIFAGMSILLIIGAWILVPETSGLTAEEIDKAYNDKVPVRQFQRHIGSGEVGA